MVASDTPNCSSNKQTCGLKCFYETCTFDEKLKSFLELGLCIVIFVIFMLTFYMIVNTTMHRRNAEFRAWSAQYDIEMEARYRLSVMRRRHEERREQRQRQRYEHPADPNPMPLHLQPRRSNEYELDNTFFLPSYR
ncbi:hypothetical protein PRIPAC_96620 [Pristionchus pacificus]|uniref:Uncharacterized protein n=1 Tax=Pristionchus pacificus TaxID=54126 RepID=A0A2A6BDB3_PRIPA|nr:hypothetical protein PRIPAC_96620 [Pristionchus pacificus]|eukprot:PDM63873.1 hypothetical protein PRIPAC_49846 [Pristionchus pacificus]